MNEQTNVILCEDVVVPESALLKREPKNRFGSVEGLDDSELANPDELERIVYKEQQVLFKTCRRRGWQA